MKQDCMGYRYIIKEYLCEFVRGFKLERLGILAYISIGYLYANWLRVDELNWMGGIPIAFAMVSGAFHMVSLPPMMYLIPYSQKRREKYIQKMLCVKIGVPICFALVWDLIALFINPIGAYAMILQITMVAIVTYICGTLNDGAVNSMEKKIAYGRIRDFVGIPLILCYISGSALFMICMDSISDMEFYIVLGVVLLVFLPFIIIIRKRWKRICANFANYEIATKLEVR